MKEIENIQKKFTTFIKSEINSAVIELAKNNNQDTSENN